VYARRAPRWVDQAHIADQLADFQLDLRSAAARSRFPSPEQSKSAAMPADRRFRLHNRQCVHDTRCNLKEANENQAIEITESRALRNFLRSTLSWQRNVKISGSSEALDRSTSITAQQISLSTSAMGQSIAQFAVARQPDGVYDRDRHDCAQRRANPNSAAPVAWTYIY